MVREHALEAQTADVLAAGDDYVLAPIENLDGAVGMPDGQVARVEDAALEEFCRGFRVFVVPPAADVPDEGNLTDFLAVLSYVLDASFGDVVGGFYYADHFAGNEAVACDSELGRGEGRRQVTLASHHLVHLCCGKVVPFWEEVALCDRAVTAGCR